MPKDSYAELDSDFKLEVANLDELGIRKRIAAIALNQVALNVAMKEDIDLADRKAAAKEAGLVYKEGTKANKLRIAFCRQVLEDMGKDVGSFE